MAQRLETTPWAQVSEVKLVAEINKPVPVSAVEPPASAEHPQNYRGIFESASLDREHLERRRIVSFDGSDERSRPIDMLRVQVLRTMSEEGWQVLAVASPSSGCGSTFTSVNLAASITRQGEKNVLLVDLHLRKPDVVRCLGLSRHRGLPDYLMGHAELHDIVVNAEHSGRELWVLPAVRPVENSIDLVTSSRLRLLMDKLKRLRKDTIIILDMPPILTGADAVALLPLADCLLLVLAAGQSSTAEVETCRSRLGATNVAAIVLNMDREAAESVS
jgi:protein-tyrosine kinase